MKSLIDLHKDISGTLNSLEANRLNDLRDNIAELINALENRDEQFKAEDIAQARLRLAVTALRVSQKTIPMLTEISDELLRAAGADAIRQACNSTRTWADKEIPSEFKLPQEFAGIVARARAAVSSLVAR